MSAQLSENWISYSKASLSYDNPGGERHEWFAAGGREHEALPTAQVTTIDATRKPMTNFGNRHQIWPASTLRLNWYTHGHPPHVNRATGINKCDGNCSPLEDLAR
jgi:hypothetical protein